MESFVDVPVTLDEVRARHAPPQVQAKIEHVDDPNRTCGGRNPLCLLFVVPGVGSALTPNVELAALTEGDVVTYAGIFELSGQFREARVRAGREMRLIAPLELSCLGKTVIVEKWRAPVDAEGRVGQEALTPLPPQLRPKVDLLAECRARLGVEKDPTLRARIALEAERHYREGALELLRERFADERESEEVKVAIVQDICRPDAHPSRRPAYRALLDALPARVGPELAERFLFCLEGDATPERTRRLLEPLVRELCTLDSDSYDDEHLDALARHGAAVGRLLAQGGLSCASESRRVLLRVALDMPLRREEITAALGSSDPWRWRLARALDADRKDERSALLDALGREKDGSTIGWLLVPLGKSAAAPTAEELEALAAVYARSGDYVADDSWRHSVLELMVRAKDAPRTTAEARERLHAALASTAQPEQPRLRIALVVLGEHGQALPAVRGIGGALNRGWQSTLVGRGLDLMGCTHDEIEKAHEIAAASGAETGALCVK